MARNARPEPPPPDLERPNARPAPDAARPDEQRPGERRTYSAEEVSQGYIVLRTRTRRVIFFGGLIAAVVFAILVGFFT